MLKILCFGILYALIGIVFHAYISRDDELDTRNERERKLEMSAVWPLTIIIVPIVATTKFIDSFLKEFFKNMFPSK